MQSVDQAQPAASAGALLAAARRERGLSVDEVSARTRVRASLIEQIERDDYTHCGGTVYARGHLRSIASTLGVAAGDVLAAYDATHEPETGPVFGPPPGEFDPLRGSGRRGISAGDGGFRWGTAMIVSLAVVCLLAVVVLLLPSGSDSDDAPPDRDARPSAAPSAPAVPVPAPSTAASASPAAAPTGINLVLAARDAQSWLEVRDDDRRVLLSQLLQSGDSRTVTAPGALHVRLGNAGAVDLTCNGRSLGPTGGAGQVLTIRVTPGTAGGCDVGQEGRSPLAAASSSISAVPAPTGAAN